MSKVIWKGAEALRPFLVAIDDLEPFPGNPRRGDIPALRASLRRFGQVKAIVVDGKRIVAHHHIRLAAKEEGWTHVAVIENAFANEEEARAFLITDNRTSELGSYDRELLMAQLDAVRDSTDIGLVGTGYDQSAYDDLRASIEQDHAKDEPPTDDAPPVPEVPESQDGEVYELGSHRLLCGDARDPDLVAKLLAGETIDLLWTDPPYGVAYAGKNEFLNQLDRGNRIQEEIEGDHLTPEQTAELWAAAFTAARPSMRVGASFYVTGPGDSLLELLMGTLRDSGFPMRQMIIWAKDQFVLGRRDYHGQHEPIVYGWVEGSHRFYGPAGESTLWQIARPRQSKLHPTMKPIELIARSLRNSTRPGELIYDPFGGSGSTLIASEWLGRRCFTAELKPGYADVIRKRYADFVAAKTALTQPAAA